MWHLVKTHFGFVFVVLEINNHLFKKSYKRLFFLATWPQLVRQDIVSDVMELWAASSHLQKYDKGVDGLYIRQPSTSVELCGPEQHTETLTAVDSAFSYIQQPKTATRHVRRLTRSEGWPRVHLFMLRSHRGSWSTSCHIYLVTCLLNLSVTTDHVVTAVHTDLCVSTLHLIFCMNHTDFHSGFCPWFTTEAHPERFWNMSYPDFQSL